MDFDEQQSRDALAALKAMTDRQEQGAVDLARPLVAFRQSLVDGGIDRQVADQMAATWWVAQCQVLVTSAARGGQDA